MFLLDTDVISLATKGVPHPSAMRWLGEQPLASLHISVITLFEIQTGIHKMPSGKRRSEIERWLEETVLRFDSRILPVSNRVALDAGYLLGKARSAGHNLATNDPLIAATARLHQLTLATLNRKDFQHLQVPLVDFQAAL